MATVIRLEEHRKRRRSASDVARLERAVDRLDPLVRASGPLTGTIERQLAAISGAVADGRPDEAAERAERLLGILEHPAASGAR